jgi:aspartate/methionine/tyrosine aminotransferase
MLPDFRLETWFSRWEFDAPWNLAASDMATMRLDELLALADTDGRAAWHQLSLGYTPTFGTPALREAIAATYEGISPDEVIAFSGAEEGIWCAVHAAMRAGDHAVVVIPCYQSSEEIPRSIGTVTGVPLRWRNGWVLDLDEVRDALRPETRLLIMNFPHNPTGHVIPEDDFRALVALAEARGIALLSDEVYRGLERPPRAPLPQAADLGARTMSLGVLSKAYGLAGLRVGWIACRDRAALVRMERMRHYLSICGSAPGECLATIALRARGQILARNRTLRDTNLVRVESFMDAHRTLFEWSNPAGGCIAFPRYLGADGVEAFCRRAVEESGVILLPASLYASSLGDTPTDRFRLGFGRGDLPDALEVLGAHLARAGPQ